VQRCRSFEQIRPPSSIESLNSKLSGSLDAMGKAVRKLVADISRQDATAASADAAGDYGDVIIELDKRGVKFSGT
jgi:HPt (histidine-containing phosphotransfer) domain-containing protein